MEKVFEAIRNDAGKLDIQVSPLITPKEIKEVQDYLNRLKSNSINDFIREGERLRRKYF